MDQEAKEVHDDQTQTKGKQSAQQAAETTGPNVIGNAEDFAYRASKLPPFNFQQA